MKKIFALLALTSLLFNFAFAEDFLAKVSKGALSDTSPGVKKLNLEEMKEVKGGYYDTLFDCGASMCYALANHAKSFFSMTPREKAEWQTLTYGDVYLFVGFLAQNNWSVSSLGRPYNYFTYTAVMLDPSGQIHQLSN